LGLIINLKKFDYSRIDSVLRLGARQFHDHGSDIINLTILVLQKLCWGGGQILSSIKVRVTLLSILLEKSIKGLILLGCLLDGQANQFILSPSLL
jgi:hypothetical protein